LIDVPVSAQFVLLACLLVISGFFSLAETAMMAANRYRLRHLAQAGHRGADWHSTCCRAPTNCSGSFCSSTT
jgi:Mg2+/Co2+ transporter CorB